MKILLALDGSEYSKRMLAYIAAHDELLGPSNEYTLLTAIAPLPPHAARYVDPEAVKSYYADQARSVLDAPETFCRQQKWAMQSTHVVAHAAQGISEFAEQGKFDLIVMGTRGHSSLVNMVLGSVSTGVLARCKIPTLLVH